MSGTYQSVLPVVFGYSMDIPAGRVAAIAELLSASRDGAPYGSSFAVTSEPGGDMRRIYLSDVSMATIEAQGMLVLHYDDPPKRKLGPITDHEYRPDVEKTGWPCLECGPDTRNPVHRG